MTLARIICGIGAGLEQVLPIGGRLEACIAV